MPDPVAQTRPDAAPMAGVDVAAFVALAALWGASFMFTRVAVPVFGALPTMALRCGIAALVLVPVTLARGGFGPAAAIPGRMFVSGLVNSAIPFAFFGYAALSLPAGIIAILNATAPIWGALVAWSWLGERLSRIQVAGLLLAFAGVAVLVSGRGGLAGQVPATALLAPLVATLMYGIAVNYNRRYLAGVPSLPSAAGAQLGAAIALAPAGYVFWPQIAPDRGAWLLVVALGVLCTAIPYVLYFRLIQRTGPARAIAVTFLIPVFGVFWGAWLLDEIVNFQVVAGGATILAGTALSIGILERSRRG